MQNSTSNASSTSDKTNSSSTSDKTNSSSNPETSNTLDIVVDGEKKGFAYDVNPISVDTDEECKKLLCLLKETLDLTPEQVQLIEQCLTVVTSAVDNEVPFGPGEIFELGRLALAFPESANEIIACSHHLCASVECEGDLPPNIYLELAQAYGALGDCMSKLGNDGDDSDESEDSDDDDLLGFDFVKEAMNQITAEISSQ